MLPATTIAMILTLTQQVTAAPLPGSAAMGLALIGGIAIFARFPSSRHKRRRLQGGLARPRN